jgi:glyoxylase-like metal-dependent hydrolase (beta-lactamase superfamily II)
MIAEIDLRHMGIERTVACYLVETEEGPALFDCGPSSTIPALKEGLAARGLELRDVRNLLLSHIHLDHAGAAGALVREHPELTVWVSEVGAPHLVDPSRLERSARRLYLDSFDTLWGELAPVPQERIRLVGARVLGLECFPTPGHASHHVTYVDADGVSYNGDVAGVRIPPGTRVFPPTPPPDIDVDAWNRSLDELERRRPERLALVHFGTVEDPAAHLAELREVLARWAEHVRSGLGQEEFVETVRAESGDFDADAYERAAPLWQCWLGLRRYWDKRAAPTAA